MNPSCAVNIQSSPEVAAYRVVKKASAIYLTILLYLIALCVSPSARAQAHDPQSQPPPSAAEIIKGLQNPDPVHRENAAKAATGIKPLPLALVPHVLDSFRLSAIDLKYFQPVDQRSRETRGYLVTALVNAGTPAIPQLELALNDPDASVRTGAVAALAQSVTAPPPSYPILIKALASTHDDVVRYVEGAIAELMGVQRVPLLLDSLNDSNPRIRSGSAVALSYILSRYGGITHFEGEVVQEKPTQFSEWVGPPPTDVVLAVAKRLNDLDPLSRLRIIDSLTGLESFAEPAIPYVLPALKDSDPKIRMSAVNFLNRVGPAAKVAVPGLIQCLNDPDESVRLGTMDTLGIIGPAAKDAIPALDIAMKSVDNDTSEHAAMALASIDPGDKAVLPIMMRTLNEWGETDDAIEALGKMGSYARPAVPTIEHLLATNYGYDRQAAVTALARIEGGKAVPTLARTISGDKDESVRLDAVIALGGLGSTDSDAISALVAAFSNDSDNVKEAASNQLGKLGAAAAPALIAALKNGDLYQRAWSVQTLSQIKPLPDDAVHALTLALSDKSEIVRTEAADALKGDEVSAGETVGQQRMDEHENDTVQEQDLDSLVAAKPVTDSPTYSKAEIFASIPPDENHEYPSELKFSVPIVPSGGSAEEAEFLVTVRSAKDGDDQLAVWKRTGENKYQRLGVQQSELDSHFEKPEVFSSRVLVTGRWNQHYETALFVDLPVHRYSSDWDGINDTVFVLDHDQLRPVEIQDAIEYSKKLRDRESNWNSIGNKFSDNDLEFGFSIWEAHDCHACPSGGRVDGTYKVVKEMTYDADKKDWSASWEMLVDTSKRTGGPESKGSRRQD
jgi:HEAT repeat protein